MSTNRLKINYFIRYRHKWIDGRAKYFKLFQILETMQYVFKPNRCKEDLKNSFLKTRFQKLIPKIPPPNPNSLFENLKNFWYNIYRK